MAATVSVLGLLLPLAIAEIGLRMFWEGYYLKETVGRLQKDETYGWINTPGFLGIHGAPEFKVAVTHDSHGFRGGEVSPDRIPGSTRVVFLGDSMTYGHAVEDDEAFVSLLGERLESVESINMAVGGYNTAQQYMTLQEKALPFDPDLVVLCVFWNDIYWENIDTRGPWFDLKDGVLVHKEADADRLASARFFQPPSLSKRILSHSHVYRVASDGLKKIRALFKDSFGEEFEEGSAERERKTWEITEALLAAMGAECRERKVPFLIVLIPDQVEVETDKRVLGLPPQFAKLPERLANLADQLGLPYTTPLECLKTAYEAVDRPFYFPINRHLTPEGNLAMANCLAPVILKTLRNTKRSESPLGGE